MRPLCWVLGILVLACGAEVTGGKGSGKDAVEAPEAGGSDVNGAAETPATDATEVNEPGPGGDVDSPDADSSTTTEPDVEILVDSVEPAPDTDPAVDTYDAAADIPVDPPDVGPKPDAPISKDIGGPTCEVAGTLELGESVSSTTTGANAALGVESDQCPNSKVSLGKGSAPDEVWRFVADSAGDYKVVLEADFHASVYVLADCDTDATCFGASSGFANGTVQVPVSLSKGQEIFVVADGYGTEDDAGTFTLTVSKVLGFGQTCAPAYTIGCGETISGLDLSDSSQATKAFTEYTACTSFASADDAEIVATFTAVADGDATIDAPYGIDVYVLEDEGGVCDEDESQCLDNGYGLFTFAIEAGKSYFVVFEDYSQGDVPFEVNLTCCESTCAGKTCGDDGCGGTCGTCDAGALCTEGSCQELSTTCAPAQVATCDSTIEGLDFNDGAQATAAFSDYPGCDETGYDTPEIVVTFTPDIDVTVDLDGFYGVDLYILQDDAGVCDPSNECLDSSYGYGSFSAKAGETYYLVFEEYYDPGVFDVEVTCCASQCDGKDCGDDGCGGSCGTCPNGYCGADSACVDLPDVCTPIDTVECGQTLTSLTNGTPLASKAFGKYSCQTYLSDDFSASPELVYAFTADADQKVTVAEADYSSAEVTVLADLGGGCADADGSCLIHGYSSGDFLAKAGETYYFVWDSYSTSEPILTDFEFSVTCCTITCEPGACGMSDGCGGTCGCLVGEEKCNAESECELLGEGETCSDPFVLEGSLPATAEGDTSFAGASFFAPDGKCSNMYEKGKSGKDHVYEFDVPENGTYKITLDATFDSVIYVTTDCADVGASCVGGIDGNYSSGVETLYAKLQAGTTAYIVVDGYSASTSGTYTLEVGPPCYASCDGTKCGYTSDGCGGYCTCEAGLACTGAETCVVPPEGDLCENAVFLDPADLPISVAGDTEDGYTDQYDYQCDMDGPNGEPDLAYSFTPTESGSYAINLTQDDSDPTYLSIMEGCDGAICLASDDLYLTDEPLVVDLEAGVEYSIVVDSYTGESGPYILTIDLE